MSTSGEGALAYMLYHMRNVRPQRVWVFFGSLFIRDRSLFIAWGRAEDFFFGGEGVHWILGGQKGESVLTESPRPCSYVAFLPCRKQLKQKVMKH